MKSCILNSRLFQIKIYLIDMLIS